MNNRIFHIFHKIVAEVLCIQVFPVLFDNIRFIIQYSQYIKSIQFYNFIKHFRDLVEVCIQVFCFRVPHVTLRSQTSRHASAYPR